MRATDAPLTPDGDEAREWVSTELAKAEYGDDLSPLTRGIRWILRTLAEALGGGTGNVPVAAILITLFAFLLLIAAIVVWRNPVRLSRKAMSSAVFDGEGRSAEESDQASRAAASQGQWDEALVWAFRVMVLYLAARRVVRDGPGLTAKEATTQASVSVPQAQGDLEWASTLFDGVRYGTDHAHQGDWERMNTLTEVLKRAPRREAPSPVGSGAPPTASTPDRRGGST